MKNINIEFENTLNKGIPCELFLYIGNLLKSKEETFIHINSQNDAINNILYNKIFGFLRHYKIKTLLVSKTKLEAATTYKVQNKLNLCFSQNVKSENLEENNVLKNFVKQYEIFFGSLPFYLEKKKYVDKFLFINDVILQFGVDIVLH